MRRFLAIMCALLLAAGVSAQNDTSPQRGDPPVAALISVSPADASGVVTISGAAGAVFPTAQVAIRNLYTQQVVYTQAGVTGSFQTQIYGPGNTPFWISPATAIPGNVRDLPGSLPGGPGTIIYGLFPETLQETLPVTQLVIDGSLDDWEAYPQAALALNPREVIYALRNNESLYIGLSARLAPPDQQRLRVLFTLDGSLYALTVDPRLEEQTATWRRLEPNPADLGTLAVATTQADAMELRIPLLSLRPLIGVVDVATVEQVQFITVDEVEQAAYVVGQDVQPVNEVDGVVYLNHSLGREYTRFTIAGTVARGSQTWSARGRIQSLNLVPGERLSMQLDVTMNAPDLAASLVGLKMIGQLYLQPVTGADGLPVSGGLYSNNGWSAVLTPSGLPVDNLRSDFLLGETITPAPQVLRRDGRLIFGLAFDLQLPEDLPPGLYVPVFRGLTQIADGERVAWEENGLLGQGTGAAWTAANRLPLTLVVGDVPQNRLIWTLFQDHPSNGSRGVLAREDSAHAALSNRVRFNSPTYILPPLVSGTENPAAYPLEPYLLSQMPNTYESTTAPLLPFLFPGGRLNVRVTRPNGTVDNLGTSPVVQSRLSTAADDERALFGAQTQVDIYRLTTANPALLNYRFDQYGLYEIELTGDVEDVWGRRYTGGGTYEVLIAEQFDLTPAMLPGTPFEVGDTFHAGLTLAPGAPAEVTITARLYPLDGGDVVEQVISGTANDFGYFHDSAASFTFETPGEYVIDYEARYTDAAGRLWAGSLRAAGVVASPDSAFIAHGQRGLANYAPGWQPAWFNTVQYAPPQAAPQMQYPYHSGDVLWYDDDRSSVVRPALTVQDTTGDYRGWLTGALDKARLTEAARRAQLPAFTMGDPETVYPPALLPEETVNHAYAYISVLRPGLAVRQYIVGRTDGGLTLGWDADDPLNGQIGAGLLGEVPGDYAFLFGGVIVRNEQAGVNEAAIYGAAGITINADNDPRGARVYPPYNGEAGGPNGGALLFEGGQPLSMFFHPTGIRPGQVLSVGDTVGVSGHVVPPLASIVSVRVTNPTGETQVFEGTANAVGYFYDAASDFVVDEAGLWTVEIQTRHEGLTSAGIVQPPYPQGGILGAPSDVFHLYVLPKDGDLLTWNDTRPDILIPPGLPYNFNFTLPESWTGIEVYHTVTIPGYIVSSGSLNLSGRSFSYQYNPSNLNRDFPVIELDSRSTGAAISDPLTLSFMATGLDAEGRLQFRSRTYTIFHNRVLTLH